VCIPLEGRGLYTLSPKLHVISEGGSHPSGRPTRRNRIPALHELHGLREVLIDNGQWIGDTVVTVEVDRKHAMEMNDVIRSR
jgi:hypothetical protein